MNTKKNIHKNNNKLKDIFTCFQNIDCSLKEVEHFLSTTNKVCMSVKLGKLINKLFH